MVLPRKTSFKYTHHRFGAEQETSGFANCHSFLYSVKDLRDSIRTLLNPGWAEWYRLVQEDSVYGQAFRSDHGRPAVAGELLSTNLEVPILTSVRAHMLLRWAWEEPEIVNRVLTSPGDPDWVVRALTEASKTRVANSNHCPFLCPGYQYNNATGRTTEVQISASDMAKQVEYFRNRTVDSGPKFGQARQGIITIQYQP